MTDDYNPFEPENLRLDVSFSGGSVGVKKLLTTIPVRKPNPEDFSRVHADPAYRLTPAAAIELKSERELYLVAPHLVPELASECKLYTLYTAMTRQKVLFIWPVRLPSEDRRQMDWHRSMAEAAEKAMSHWVRVRSNLQLGAYEIDLAVGNLANQSGRTSGSRTFLRSHSATV
jgi:hypothetical protein